MVVSSSHRGGATSSSPSAALQAGFANEDTVLKPNDSSSFGSFSTVTKGLAEIYTKHVLPMEKDYRFHQFYSPPLTEGDFRARPMILLLGQYSTGKTTFVKNLLEQDYPGLRIGPEPTTDKFVAVCHSDIGSEQDHGGPLGPPEVLPGHAAVVDQRYPWSQLEVFGPNFLSRFEVVHVNSKVFKGITLIDTPGVLAGNKQWERGYDFEGVIKWFAERVDLCLLFFDAHKLDISDEFRRCILALRGYESKVSILLNKADSVNTQQLMRVYGALMWSLGKVMVAPEVPRIYIGSFWDKELKDSAYRNLFESEWGELHTTIFNLPARSAGRKVDDFIKRTRVCRTHCLLMNHMRKHMPHLLGKTSKQKELLNSLPEIYRTLSLEERIPLSEFPDMNEFRTKLIEIFPEIHRLPKLEGRRLRDLSDTVRSRVTELTALIPREEVSYDDVYCSRLPSEPPCSADQDTNRLRSRHQNYQVPLVPAEYQNPVPQNLQRGFSDATSHSIAETHAYETHAYENLGTTSALATSGKGQAGEDDVYDGPSEDEEPETGEEHVYDDDYDNGPYHVLERSIVQQSRQYQENEHRENDYQDAYNTEEDEEEEFEPTPSGTDDVNSDDDDDDDGVAEQVYVAQPMMQMDQAKSSLLPADDSVLTRPGTGGGCINELAQ